MRVVEKIAEDAEACEVATGLNGV